MLSRSLELFGAFVKRTKTVRFFTDFFLNFFFIAQEGVAYVGS